jgi:Fungal protein kinase
MTKRIIIKDRLTVTSQAVENTLLLGHLACRRAIHDFISVKLLAALLDTMKSLYLTRCILHRDISKNNIFTDLEEADGCSGVLVDLDLAKKLVPAAAAHDIRQAGVYGD